jgi:uncharacterized protein YeaO (DUF488 family)
MGLGRTTRFAPLPAGSRRVSVMRTGTTGYPELGPSPALLTEFTARKRELVKRGRPSEVAHAETARLIDYRRRYRAEIRASAAARAALRKVVDEARERDLYLMCMCPYRTREQACHTYLLLELARELDPTLRLLPEPHPRAIVKKVKT